MRNKTRVALAAIAACALTIGTAVPAGAQEEPESLGFAVDKTEGPPGALVLGKANAADVAEHCVTELEPFQARFGELLEVLAPGGAFDGEMVDRFFPGGELVIDNHDQLAYSLLVLLSLGISNNLNGAAEQALPQTFVMTFADIATQDPVGERGNFDPNTGDGSVVVPDIEPGDWAVAAACVGPIIDDLDALEAGIRAGGDFLEEIGAPAPLDPQQLLSDPEFIEFLQEFLDTDETGLLTLVSGFLGVIGADFLEPIVTPDAFGAVLFCIHNDQGECPGPPPPPPELDEDDFEEPPPAPPVVAQPSFTG